MPVLLGGFLVTNEGDFVRVTATEIEFMGETDVFDVEGVEAHEFSGGGVDGDLV